MAQKRGRKSAKRGSKKKKSKSKSKTRTNINQTEYDVMEAINENDGNITPAELAESSDSRVQVAGRRLTALRNHGFLRHNKNSNRFSFTAAGTRVFNSFDSSSASPARGSSPRTSRSSRSNNNNSGPNVRFSSRTGTITISGFTQAQIDNIVAASIGGQFAEFVEQIGNSA